MQEDQMKILKMIENGTITADEGMKLLQAIGGSEEKKGSANRISKPSHVRILVENEFKSKPVTVKLPIGLFKAGIKLGEKFSPEFQGAMSEVDYDAILTAINEGTMGEIMSVDTDDGSHVSIFIE